MTLVDISNQIIENLVKSEKFTRSDFDNIKIPKDIEDDRENLVLNALSALEDDGFIIKISSNLWLLTIPIGTNGQNVTIGLKCANAIASTINPYLESRGSEHRVDKLNILEEDIIALIQIIGELLNDDPIEPIE